MITGDNPIKNPEDDVIGRDVDAREFAQNVLEIDPSEGVVVGVLGPWGSGKTSFINLARNELKKKKNPILDFNPWMFSGTAQLVESFFIELASQLKMDRNGRLTKVSKLFETYGRTFSGLGGSPLLVLGSIGAVVRRKFSVSSFSLNRRALVIGDANSKKLYSSSTNRLW